MSMWLSEQYCTSHRTKKASRGYKVLCPSCSGNDLWVTLDTKVGFCFECGARYRIGDESSDRRSYQPQIVLPPLDTVAIRQLYGEATNYYAGCLSDAHLRYLHARGLSDAIIADFKIGYCNSSYNPIYRDVKLARDAGLIDSRGMPWLVDRIVFPYIAETEVTDMRGRSLPDSTDPMRYKSLYHRPERRGAVYPYNHDRAYTKVRDTKTLIITEGELKAIVGDMYGFAVVALPGMLSHRSIVVPNIDTRLVVMFDNSSDADDRLRIDKAISRLCTRIPPFYVATLPLLGNEKMDIDSFLLHPRGGPDMFASIVSDAVEYNQYRELRRF